MVKEIDAVMYVLTAAWLPPPLRGDWLDWDCWGLLFEVLESWMTFPFFNLSWRMTPPLKKIYRRGWERGSGSPLLEGECPCPSQWVTRGCRRRRAQETWWVGWSSCRSKRRSCVRSWEKIARVSCDSVEGNCPEFPGSTRLLTTGFQVL